MKRNLFIQAIIFSLAILLLMVGLVFFELALTDTPDNVNNPPRRYIVAGYWHNFNELTQINFYSVVLFFDRIFFKVLDLLIIVQSFFAILKLKIKNSFLINGWLLCSLIGGVSIFLMNSFHHYFVTGLNPILMYVPIFFLVLQIVIWIYLNLVLFKRLAEKNSDR